MKKKPLMPEGHEEELVAFLHEAYMGLRRNLPPITEDGG